MRDLLFITVAFSVLISCTSSVESNPTTTTPDGYDSLMAQDVGADAYGMRKFVIAYLKKGPNRDQESLAAADLQRAHMDNIGRMADAGKLVLAGPFMDDGDVMGIYVFAVETIEEAQELTASDPAVQAGRLIMELHPWYGSAALMKINELHKKVRKEAI